MVTYFVIILRVYLNLILVLRNYFTQPLITASLFCTLNAYFTFQQVRRELLRHNNINGLLDRRLVSFKRLFIYLLIERLKYQKFFSSLSSINSTFSNDFLLAIFKVLISAISFDIDGYCFSK